MNEEGIQDMNKQIFRKQSVDRMSSPEQLNDYIKVTNPGVWMVLAAIVILLVGVCVWGVFGKLETKLSVAAVSQDGQTVLYVKEDNIASVRENMSVYVGDDTYKVTSVSSQPVAVTEEISEYARHTGELSIGEWVYIVPIDGNMPDGVYRAQVVVDSVSPLYFVFN